MVVLFICKIYIKSNTAFYNNNYNIYINQMYHLIDRSRTCFVTTIEMYVSITVYNYNSITRFDWPVEAIYSDPVLYVN